MPQVAELRWGANIDLGVNDQAHLQALVLNLKLLRIIGGNSFDPSYVNLTVDARPRDMEEIEQIAACRVHARAGSNAIGFPVQALDKPIASANRLIFRPLGGYLARVESYPQRAAHRQLLHRTLRSETGFFRPHSTGAADRS